MRKFTLLFFSFVFLSAYAHSQTFNWVSSSQFGGENEVNGTSCDDVGNIYYSGTYSNPCQHCSPPPPGGWFAKYTSSNNLIWQDTVNNVSWLKGITNANGDFFITGNFWFSIRLGQFLLGSPDTTWNLQGGTHGFIAKYNSSGVCQWAKVIPYASCNDIVVNGNNIFITGFGNHSGSKVSTFDSIPFDGTKSLFVAKYSDAGHAIWVKGFTHGIGWYEKNLIHVNDSTIYLSGRFDNGRGFVTKLKINGDSLWTKSAPTCPYGITVNNQNELYCVGYFSGKDTIDNVIYGNSNIIYSGYIIRFDINGSINFVKAICPVGNVPVFYCQAIDFKDGNLYITAPLESGTIVFDGDTVSALANAGLQLVIFKMNESGNLIWERHSETPFQYAGTCWGNIVCKSKTDNFLYVSGATNGPIQFDSLFLNASGYESFFRCQLSDNSFTAINELEEKINPIFIYPNPSSGIFTIQMHDLPARIKITVRDVLGKCLLEKNGRGENSQEINLSCQPKGIYFVELLSGEERVVRKVVVQ